MESWKQGMPGKKKSESIFALSIPNDDSDDDSNDDGNDALLPLRHCPINLLRSMRVVALRIVE